MYGELNLAPYVGVYDELDWQTTSDLGFNISEFLGVMDNNTILFILTALGNVGEYIDINF
jgi:hypothetical protein